MLAHNGKIIKNALQSVYDELEKSRWANVKGKRQTSLEHLNKAQSELFKATAKLEIEITI